MKKLLVIAVVVAGLMMAGYQNAAAQNKFGYFDLEYVVSVMPGVEKVDTLLAQFEQDSLGQEYQFRLSEFQRNDSTLKKDSATMPARLYQERRQKLIQDFYVLQNWQQYSQQVMQSKQQELMAPYLNKVLEAFQNVVTEQKYTYVFKREGLWIAPPGDNLIPQVAKKLGIKLPADPNAPAETPKQQPAPKTAPKTGTKQ